MSQFQLIRPNPRGQSRVALWVYTDDHCYDTQLSIVRHSKRSWQIYSDVSGCGPYRKPLSQTYSTLRGALAALTVMWATQTLT